ncbi:hypothetical protein [Pontimicrobium sp. IMCC45349]|uniref:hypothetical protein n=1 Tax=Pontimicrobium sp. IMCC45349 TaxID=3391574 RepID=UPI0039A1F900
MNKILNQKTKVIVKQKFIALIVCITFGNNLLAQNTSTPISEYVDHYSNVVPETPNAATFTKYGGTTLNLSKGLPNISIPIYNLEVDGVNIPISLSYDASGIRTDELATAVGLKWRLNAGGGVFRSINNEADDNGWLTTNWSSRDDQWYVNNPISNSNTQNYLKNNAIDHSPDNFSYSIANYSGSFIFKRQDVNTVLKNKNDNFKLIANRPTQAILSFTGKDIDGNTYVFGSDNLSREFNNNEVIIGSNTSINNSSENYISSWMIESITTKNSKTIDFEYISYNMDYTISNKSDKVVRYKKYTGQNQTNFCGYLGSGQGTYNTGDYEFTHSKTHIINRPKNKLLSKISTETIEVNFNYEDINNGVVWNKKLTSIEIVDLINNNTKKFDFTYGFYNGYNGDQRLRLEEVAEISGNEQKPPYKFTYNNDYPLPSKDTFSKDFFGYYNGASNLSSSIPFTPEIYSNLPLILKYDIADRRPSLPHLLSGNLTEIQYPTGGKTQLEYELNQEDNGLGDYKYAKGGFNLSLQNNSFTSFSNGFGIYTQNFTVPDHTIVFNTYANSGSTSNILQQSISNAVDPNGAAICNDPENFGPGFDCSQFQIKDSNNNIVETQLIGYGSVLSLPPGDYQIIVKVREAEINATSNLSVHIDFTWYHEFYNTNQEKIRDPQYAGGLRVKKTIDVDTDGRLYNEVHYEYSGLVGQNRMHDDFSELYVNNDEYTMSSDFIGHPKLSKSGYFYKNVTVNKIGRDENNFPFELTTTHKFDDDYTNNSYESVPVSTMSFNENGDVLTKTLYEYTTSQTPSYYNVLGKSNYCYSEFANTYTGFNSPQSMSFIEYESRLSKQIETQYFYNGISPNGNLSTVTSYNYNANELISQQEVDLRLTEISNLDYFDPANYTSNSDSDKLTSNYSYSTDFLSEPLYQDLVNNKNILSIPVKVEILSLNNAITNNNVIDSKYCLYDSNGNLKEIYNFSKGFGSNSSPYNYIPSNYELHSVFNIKEGKLIESQRDLGVKSFYLWDATKTLLLAKIDNASENEVANALGVTIAVLEDFTEANLSQINGLRASLPTSQVTTFTYEPLVGVTSVTDPKGYVMYYEYDAFGRLEYVKDKDNNILSKNEYNYRPQN